MNKKGFAISAILYSIIIIAILVFFLVLALNRNTAQNNKLFIENIKTHLNVMYDLKNVEDPEEDPEENMLHLVTYTVGAANLFGDDEYSKDKSVPGYIASNNTIAAPDFGNRTSHFIRVMPTDILQLSLEYSVTAADKWYAYTFYDINENPVTSRSAELLSGTATKSGTFIKEIIVPKNASYIRVSTRYNEGNQVKLSLRSPYNYFDNKLSTAGYLNEAGENPTQSRSERTSNFIAVKPESILEISMDFVQTPDYKWFSYMFFDEEYNKITNRYNNHLEGTENATNLFKKEIVVPTYAKYIKISARYLDNELIKLSLRSNHNKYDMNTSSIGFLNEEGLNPTQDYEDKTSDFIPVIPNNDLMLILDFVPTEEYKWFSYMFFDSAFNKVSNRNNNHLTGTEDSNDLYVREFSIPSNASYIKVSARYLEHEDVNLILRYKTFAKVEYIETNSVSSQVINPSYKNKSFNKWTPNINEKIKNDTNFIASFN